jgi:hypothetical protein
MSADLQAAPRRRVVIAWLVAVALTYGFGTFAFASSKWVRGDIAPWLDGVLSVTFLLFFFMTAMAWVVAGWLTVRWWDASTAGGTP